jgi:predicted lipoprotein with Yx(FWY)xxD motif
MDRRRKPVDGAGTYLVQSRTPLVETTVGSAAMPSVQHHRAVAPLVGVAFGLLVAACSGTGGGGGAYGGHGASASPSSAPASGSGMITTATSGSLGSYLVGPDGLTLYFDTKDSQGTSNCSGACATAWPPLTVPSGQQPKAGSGVSGTLGTITRSDGSQQVTYDGFPLYYWKGDSKPGDVTGQNVNGFVVASTSGMSGGSGVSPSPAASPSASASGGYGY